MAVGEDKTRVYVTISLEEKEELEKIAKEQNCALSKVISGMVSDVVIKKKKQERRARKKLEK